MTLNDAYVRIKASYSSELVEPLNAYGTTNAPDTAFLSIADGALPGRIESRGADNYVFMGSDSSSAKSIIRITGSNNVVFIGPSARLGQSKILITGNNSIFYFGAFSTCEGMTVKLSGPAGSIVVGDDCMMAGRIVIANEDGHGIYDLETGDRINANADVLIEDHVWIGRAVLISKGAQIARDSVIGQAALITRGKIPANAVVGGIPAKVLRTGTTWSRWNLPTLQSIASSHRHAAHERERAILREKIVSSQDQT